jgi:hypothetical protein
MVIMGSFVTKVTKNMAFSRHLTDTEKVRCCHTRFYWKVHGLLLLQLPQPREEAKVTLPRAYCVSLPQNTALFRLRVLFCLRWMEK